MNQNSKDGVGVTSNRELIRVTDKTVTFSTPDMKKGIRGNKLGEGYGKAELVARIAKVVAGRNAEKEAPGLKRKKSD